MSENVKIQTQNTRIKVIDALRGFALLGVVLVHMQQHYSIFVWEGLNPHTPILESWNEAVQWLTRNVLMGRFINIFAFLFGMSFFIQMDRAAKKGSDFRGRFLWRMVILFVIGLLSTCFYSGDILSLYAIYGVILLLINPLKNWVLMIFAVLLLAGTPKLTTFAYDNLKPKTEQVENQPQQRRAPIRQRQQPEEPSFISGAKQNLTSGVEGKFNYQYRMSNRGYITLAIFILGLIVGRTRFFETTHLRKGRNVVLLGLFIAGNYLFKFLSDALAPELAEGQWFAPQSAAGIISTAMGDIATVFFSATVVMAFVVLYNIPLIGKCLNVLAPYGRMGLTNYVSQSVIGCLFFAMWAWGATFGAWGAAELLLLGLAVYVAQVLVSALWLHYFKYGPLEWFWRSATYLKWQPFRK